MRKLITILAAVVAVGCTSNSHIDMQPVDVYGWSRPVSIIYDNTSTEQLRTIAVALRYNNSFDTDTLSVEVHTSLPDVHQCKERVVLNFKRDYHASAVTASESIVYRYNCALNQRGSYIFTITPCREVKGVEAVGIEIK